MRLTKYSTYQVLVVQLSPATGEKKHEHEVGEANLFLAMKPPTKAFCLQVTTQKGGKTLLLANGLVVAAAGDRALLPKEGKSGCVCGIGLAPAPGSDMEQFEAQKRCEKPAKK